MSTVAALRRLRRRLERARGGSCGPGCPPVCQGTEPWYDGSVPVLPPPAPCPRCGREPIVLAVLEDLNFFGNAARLPPRDLS
jgi:hypothetical protein